jgi:hypothetical protein
MITFLKRNYLWIILLGSLIGLNETLIGGIKMPYRSAVVSSVTLVFLSVARYYFPKRGSSLIIIMIAILFKINSAGINSCTTNALLCGPTAMLLLGIGFEIFGSIFITDKSFKYSRYILTCIITSIVIFSLYAVLQTYVLKSWDSARLVNYIFARGSLTAVASSAISVFVLYLIRHFKYGYFARLNPHFISGLLGFVIIALWLLGFYST